MAKTRRILVIDNSVDSAVYSPVAHWRENTAAEIEAYRPMDGPAPPDLGRFTHVILTGSEASITEDHDWVLRECDLVGRLVDSGVPIFGSCFGHQLLARALSGRAFVRGSPTPEFGWVEVTREPAAEKDPLLGALPRRVFSYAAHFDEVYPLPGGWQRLATSPRCENAALRWRDRPVWGIQHHPEIGIGEGERLYEMILDAAPDQRRMICDGFSPERRDSCITPALLDAFLAVS